VKEQETHTDQSNQAKKKTSKKRNIFSNAFFDVLGGEFLAYDWAVRQTRFILFLAGLALLYIGNNYYTEATSRTIDRINREIKELQFEYIYGKSTVMHESKQTEIARKLAKTGIKESVEPVEKIVVPKTSQP
jgi:hypothetical protein